MSDKVKLTIHQPENPLGGSVYVVVVEVTNVGEAPLSHVVVEPQSFAGKLIQGKDESHDDDADWLDQQRNELVQHMSEQAKDAYTNSLRRTRPLLYRLKQVVYQAMEMTFTMATPMGSVSVTPRPLIPRHMKKAFEIREWDDVQRVEMEFIELEPDGSLCRKAFRAYKEQLGRVMEELRETRQEEVMIQLLEMDVGIPAGGTRSFPFTMRAPWFLRRASTAFQVQSQFRVGEGPSVGVVNARSKIEFGAWSLSVPLGAIAGSALGLLIRWFLVNGVDLSSLTAQAFWTDALAGAAISLVAALFMRRTDQGRKLISVEDFGGGVLVGAVATIYSEQILELLKALVSVGGGA
jgi:hypothetical protein